MNNFSSDWEIQKLEHLTIKIIDGNYGSDYPSPQEMLNEGIPFLTSTVIGKDQKINLSKLKYISQEKHRLLAKAHLKENDVLFTNRGANVGNVALVSECLNDANIGPQLTLLRVNSKLSPHFLYYFMQSNNFKLQLKRFDSGSAMNFFGISTTKSLSIHVPPLLEQNKISSILNSVDEVIEYTQKQIDKLQYLKKATMNELLTKGIGHKDFKKSALGRIPKSWEVLNFSKIIHSSNQGVNTTTEKVTYSSAGIRACRSNNIEENSFDWSDKKFVNQSTFDRLNDKFKPKLKDVLYCNIGSNLGSSAVVETTDDLIITWNVLRLTTENSKVSPYFFSHSLNSSRKELRDFATESTMPFISTKALSKFKFRIPPLDEQKKISEVIDGINNNLAILKIRIYQIQSLKKSLMQDLLTGRVRVKVK